jgi:putative Ca2+/H+ antiporter (TMEM165/GDT1 family)
MLPYTISSQTLCKAILKEVGDLTCVTGLLLIATDTTSFVIVFGTANGNRSAAAVTVLWFTGLSTIKTGTAAT